MLAATPAFVHWFTVGAKESLAMIWLTWWPLVLGFGLSGVVQSVLPRDALRASLGTTSARSLAKVSFLGIISSSCSYAASAMSRALFARGASWTNTLVFMVASTNLVIELGVLLYLLLGWPFVLAQFVGGAIMIVLLALSTRFLFSVGRQQQLRTRALVDSPPPTTTRSDSWRERLRSRESATSAARFALGDLTMLRKELIAGFVIAGFLSVHVPASWWSDLFVSGHGSWTVLENAVVAPLLAVVAFVCSVGNIPLAAALWANGVAFGGVIAFIFADLITLPLLAIYRRFYGSSSTWRLFVLLWFVMSMGGLVVNGLFHVAHLLPSNHHVRALSGDFPLGATLVLNVLATIILAGTWWLARSRPAPAHVATDPVCGMSVDTTAPAATLSRGAETYFFCSLRCRDRFEHDGLSGHDEHDELATSALEAVDPVCSMRVRTLDALSSFGPDGVAYYFCSEGCQRAFLDAAPTTTPRID